MANRRQFIKSTAMLSLVMNNTVIGKVLGKPSSKLSGPIVVSTWQHGMPANEAAWEILSNKGKAIDAVEAGVRVPEADPSERSVGFGGLPDRDGRVTLDACIMDENGNCGAVAFLEYIKHPISVARLVMDKTPHVMLVGGGALDFALQQGFKKENLLTTESEADWKKWLETAEYKPIINIENHDTIGMLAIDAKGDISGACTTSGMAYKLNGRVGDSPIIGAGLFVDNEIGGACATGVGEAVIKTVGSHLVVELMRQGKSPAQACKLAVERLTKKQKNIKDLQVGYLAINKNGEYGAYSIQSGFDFAIHDSKGGRLMDSPYLLKS
jgi:N4-(beta-N-acetylglucosaminyl)-L-asparaginase